MHMLVPEYDSKVPEYRASLGNSCLDGRREKMFIGEG